MTNPHHLSRKFTRLYILALSAVAFLSVLGQGLIQLTLHNGLNDSGTVNYAGRQRFLSQQIVKNILLLTGRPATPADSVYLRELRQGLADWEKHHRDLRRGNGAGPDEADTRRLFAQLAPHFEAIRNRANQVIGERESGKPPAGPGRDEAALLAHERTFLALMDRIVFAYDHAARARVHRLRRIEGGLLVVTLLVLAAEGLLVFRPAVRKLRDAVGQLLTAETKATQMNEELLTLNQSLQEAKEELLATTHQKHLQQLSEQKVRAAYLIEGQEEERKRLARELHDGLGQMLTALKLGIEKMGAHGTFSEKGQKLLEELKTLIGQTIGETRVISFNLMPAVLSDFGIASALKLLTAQTSSNTGSNITFQTNFNGARLPKNIEIGLYRIAQEGIHNAVKYAHADRIAVELVTKKKYIHLTIADNGKGFTYGAEEEQGVAHLGINNMQERSRLINGSMKIQSEPGKGTRIHIKLPVTYLEDEQDHSVISG
ncbi:MAG TPA: ATP-binding protein [Cytophagales bacterium]